MTNACRICILGGTGFVGRSLASRLTRDGHRLLVLTRNREAHKHQLILLPTLDLIEADVYDPAALRRFFEGCAVVVNLIGILNERGHNGRGFNKVHIELTRTIIEAARDCKVRRLLYVSALNTDANRATSYYLRSKGEAERILLAERKIDVTIYRPSAIFGPEDGFFNRFAKLLRRTPLLFPLACPNAKFAPVYVGDLVEAIARTLAAPTAYNRRYQLCGPRVYTLRELVEYTARCAGLQRRIVPLSDGLSRLQAAIFDYVPGKPFSTDNYRSALVDSVCLDGGDLPLLDIEPMAVEAIVPTYLGPGGTQNLNMRSRQRNARTS